MLRFKRFLKEQRGSVQVIEAAFVYPVVILAAAALIYLGIYVFEISYLDARAKATAVMAAKTISFTGYDELGDIYTGFGLNPGDDKPGREQVRKAYEKNSPYRYLGAGEADERFSEMTGGYASGLLFASADTDCSIDVSRKMFGREVEVKIRKRISLPSVLGLAGADCFRTIEVSATLSGSGNSVYHQQVLREQPERVRDLPEAVRPPQHPGVPAGEDPQADGPRSAAV